MSIIQAQSGTFVIIGKVIGHTKGSLTSKIEALGGRVTTSINASVTAAIVGANPSYKKHDRVRAVGLPCLDGDMLAALLEHGQVDPEDFKETLDLDTLLSTLRGLAYEGPSHETWVAITEALDACAPADLPMALDYVQGLVQGWPAGPRWGEAAGEWLVAPGPWLTALLAGDQSPKYRLVRAISFSPVGVKSKQAAALFQSDQLPNLRAFDVGSSNSTNILGPTFFKAMAKADNLSGVDTLVLRPGKGTQALAKATSLPGVKHLHVRTYDNNELLFGPWAANVETLELSYIETLEALTAQHQAMPSLERLMVHVGDSMGYGDMEADLDRWAQSLRDAPIWGQVRHLHLSACNPLWLGAFCQRLGDTLGAELETLHLRAMWGLKLTGDTGRNYLEDLFSTGLATQTQVVHLGEGVEPAITDVVKALGVEVVQPGGAAPAPRVQGQAEGPLPLADGEDARRQAATLHWSDALLGEGPSYRDWEVVTAVADDLARRGDTEGLQALTDALQGWPEEQRPCPRRWLALFHREPRDPRLDLVRLLSVDLAHFNRVAKNAEVWLQAMAQSPHLDCVHTMHLHTFGKQKGLLAALTDFYRAAKPTQTRVMGKKTQDNAAVVAHLEAEGVLGIHLTGYPSWNSPVEYSGADGLDSAHVHLKVDTPEAMRQILERTDLDHVVSLRLSYHEGNMAELTFQAKPAHWSKLRHLSLTSHYYNDRGPSNLDQALSQWLGDARPAVVDCRQDGLKSALIQEGVYRRALGSVLELPSDLTWDQLRALLSEEKVRVSRLHIGHGRKSELTRLAPLLECLSPTQRQDLLGLQWPIDMEELADLEALTAALPNLTTLHLENRLLDEQRAQLLEALAAAPSTRRLGVFVPVLWHSSYKGRIKALSKKEAKVLEDGQGLRPASFWLTGPSSCYGL